MELPFLHLYRDLRVPAPAPHWPDGVTSSHFTPADAAHAHALLELAYASGGGQVPDFETWWAALSGDAEYAPELCFAVRDRNGRLVAFAQCWTSAFVKDFAVHPRNQRQGIGRALLLDIFHTFRMRGAPVVSLKVETGNPSGIRFYKSLGMTARPEAAVLGSF